MEHRYEHAVILGASGGIGAALTRHVPAGRVTALSRAAGDFELEDEDTIRRAMAKLKVAPDLVICATGALELDGVPPEKSIRALDAKNMSQHMVVNAIGPALVLKHFGPALVRDRRAVIAVLSARVGSIGDNRLGGWISYRAAKAALNQIVRTASIELARTHRLAACVALHPGTVRTELTRKYARGHPAVPADEAARHILRMIDGLGPDDNGTFCAWDGQEIPW